MDIISDLGIIIVAGGSSSRFGAGNKLLHDLGGKPVFIHSLENFLPLVLPGKTVLVVPLHEKELFQKAVDSHLPSSGVVLVPGGSCRTESVKNGLRALPGTTGIVAIHDAARPLAGAHLLKELVETARNGNCGAIAAEKMIDSVCRTGEDLEITENVSRENLWRIQTPQVFPYPAICEAYRKLGNISMTDDSTAARACGIPVKTVDNPEPNLKLTTQKDLIFLKFLLSKSEKC